MKASTQSLILMSLTTCLLSACGSTGVTGSGSNAQNVATADMTAGVFNPTTGSYPLSFKSVGFDPAGGAASVTTSPALFTDSKLVVVVTASPATRNEYTNGTYANFTANYNCVTVAVTVSVEQNGVFSDLPTVYTNRLTANGTAGCAGSQASQTIDFSSYMSSGHGNIKVKVQALTSDFDCDRALSYPYYPNPYSQILATCRTNPMRSIYQYHVVNGNIQVQTNGTRI
ncbi:MAG: hypothetical protein H7301_04195 [Cryobacterium sp.]|nr:hypothetical protein [Oligoflexia bacterium]